MSSNLQSEETIISEELKPLELARLRNENRALTQRLSDLENSYESLKREARSILHENKSLVTALRLLNNEIDKGNKHSIPEINKDNNNNNNKNNNNTYTAHLSITMISALRIKIWTKLKLKLKIYCSVSKVTMFEKVRLELLLENINQRGCF